MVGKGGGGGEPLQDPAPFIARHLPIRPVPDLAPLRLHLAVPQSGVWRLAGAGAPPYWAWCWPGGLALARHLAEHPETVAGRPVVDLGCGSGLVAIAAALAGAAPVLALDTDPNAVAAATLNAAANGVSIDIRRCDPLDGPPLESATLLVGDLFYDPVLARRVTGFLDRCLGAGCGILVGDIGRAHLPRQPLVPISSWSVPDFGDAASGARSTARVYRYARPCILEPERAGSARFDQDPARTDDL